MSTGLIRVLLFFGVGCLSGCAGNSEPRELGYEVVAAFPHDPGAWTQGLVMEDGRLYESTGLRGQSTLREVKMETGVVLRQVSLPSQYFGEGLTAMGSRLFQLTWQAGVGIIYDANTLRAVGRFDYFGEGWGLTHDGTHLIMSDGSSRLRFLDPETFQVVETVQVSWAGKPFKDLNELEFIGGAVVANVWYSDRIVWIDPETGVITHFLDGSRLLPERPPDDGAVLNGIAHDPETGRRRHNRPAEKPSRRG